MALKNWVAGDELTAADLKDNFGKALNLAVYGNGVDGNVDINGGAFSSGPITSNVLTRDAFFDDLTLSGGDLDCGGYRFIPVDFAKRPLHFDDKNTPFWKLNPINVLPEG